MQLSMFTWTITERVQKSILRQGVVQAKNEKEAKTYLIASMNQDERELYSDKKNVLMFVAIKDKE